MSEIEIASIAYSIAFACYIITVICKNKCEHFSLLDLVHVLSMMVGVVIYTVGVLKNDLNVIYMFPVLALIGSHFGGMRYTKKGFSQATRCGLTVMLYIPLVLLVSVIYLLSGMDF